MKLNTKRDSGVPSDSFGVDYKFKSKSLLGLGGIRNI